MTAEVIEGDLLAQDVEAIVNSWNRNIIPWWLLLLQGISATIKRKGGVGSFKELTKVGSIPLGEARLTTAGVLSYKVIIHVAGINMLWFVTKYSVSKSIENAMKIVNEHSYNSVVFPLIGSGSGNRGTEWSLKIMLEAFKHIESKVSAGE